MPKNIADRISSQTGGSDGSLTIAAKGADNGNQLAKTSKGLSGEFMPRGTTKIQAVKTSIIGVVKVCASCMDSAKAPSAIKKAP